VVLVNIVLKLSERKLISVLKLTVGLRLLLHCDIGQVDKGIINILEVNRVVSCASAKVALLKEIHVLVLREEDPDADVELSFVDQ